MKSPHPLDPGRLDALREQRAASRAASSAAQDKIREIHRQRSLVERDIGLLWADTTQNRRAMDSREMNAKLAELELKKSALTEEMKEATAKADPVTERAQSIGTLYRSCAEFLGVDPNA